MQRVFDHERLEVYGVAREFNREVALILRDLPRGSAESGDNLQRAGKSVTRNIAEGGGRWTLAEKIHFFQIARGSATEGAASLDELVDFGLLPPERILKAKDLAWRVVAMLIGMIRSLESRPLRQNGAEARARARSARASRGAPAKPPDPEGG